MITSYKKPRHAAPVDRMSSFKKFTAVAVICAVLAASAMSAASDGKTAYINDNGQHITVAADSTDLNTVLAEAGLTLKAGDETVVTEISGNCVSVDIKRAFDVRIKADGTEKLLRLTGGTVAQALKQANISVSANDFVTPSLDTTITKALSEKMSINVTRGVKLYLQKADEKELVYVPEGTVEAALETVGCELCNEGNGSVKNNTPVQSGMTLVVNEVFYRTTFVTEKVEPEIIEEKSADLPEGKTSVKQEGKQGTVERSFKEKYVNGELVEKKEDKTKVVSKAVDRIILVGAKNETSDTDKTDKTEKADITESEVSEKPVVREKIIESSEPAVESEEEDEEDEEDEELTHSFDGMAYSSVISGMCTAYYEVNGITATGKIPQVGMVAVNPNIIPYGTRLYIASADGSYVYGYAVAEDTGTACMAGDIVVDLYMNSEEECNAFGRQMLNIYILD